MGYYNRTCAAGTTSAVRYGPTAGPALRSSTRTDTWAQWTADVVGADPAGNPVVTWHSFFPLSGASPLSVPHIITQSPAARWLLPLARADSL